MIEPYSHQNSWEECLHIFLFVQLLQHKKMYTRLQQYAAFQLTDIHIRDYNEWVGKNCPGFEALAAWMEANYNEIETFKSSFGRGFQPKVELWSDRNKTDYFKKKLQHAFEFEQYIEQLFREKFQLELEPFLTPEGQYDRGENKCGIEIKNDTLIVKYGNVYIEYQEKSSARAGEYVPSGILKNDNSVWFLIGDQKQFWIFSKQRLVEIYHEEVTLKKQGLPSPRGIVFKVKPTSLGFVFPLKFAQKEAVPLEEVVKSIRPQ